jgi:hypothetical protein
MEEGEIARKKREARKALTQYLVVTLVVLAGLVFAVVELATGS